MTTRYIVFGLLLIILSFSVSGFEASSQNSEISVCQGSLYTDTITLKGTTDETVNIVTSDWTTAIPNKKTLSQDDKVLVSNLINPPVDAQPGKYELITVLSGKGTAELKQTLFVLDCPHSVHITDDKFSNCPCVPTLYSFEVTNTGSENTFDLYVNVNRSQYTISENPLILKKGQSKTVYVQVSSCEVGENILSFVAQPRNSQYYTTTPFYLEVRDGCYDFVTDIKQDSECGGNVTVYIENTGELRDSFIFEGESFQLRPGQNRSTVFYVNATKDFVVVSDHSEEKILNIKVNECRERNITPYIIVAIIIVIVLALLFWLFSREDSDDEFKDEWQEDKKPFPWWAVIMAVLILLCIGFILFLWRYGRFILSKILSVLSGALTFVLLYKWFFILGIIIAVIIILWYLIKKDTKKKVYFWALLVVCVGVIFLILALCFYANVCQFNVKAVSQENEIQLDTSTTFMLYKNSNKVIDMSKFVQDDDNLNLSMTEVSNLTAEIDGLKVTLIPAEDWYGTRVVNFIADDGRGGRGYSPDIRIIVQEQEANFMTPINDFFSKFFPYVLMMLLISIVLVIILILRSARPTKKVLVKKKK